MDLGVVFLFIVGLACGALAAPPQFLPLFPAYPQPQPLAPAARPIAILRQAGPDVSPEGNYAWSYETENGISAQEQGQNTPISPNESALRATGAYQYTSPEGLPVQISYVADENGFRASGSAIPTPPPIPAAIQRSLEFNARHARGVVGGV